MWLNRGESRLLVAGADEIDPWTRRLEGDALWLFA